MYFYQGRIRTTRRVVADDNQYLDLHPGEEALLRLLDGTHTLVDFNAATNHIRQLQKKVPIRNGTDLIVQLDNIGALA